mgnify:FL=1
MIQNGAELIPLVTPQPDWLIADFLHKGTFTCLAGDSNVGKSYFGYSLTLRLALGIPIFGIANPPRNILYFDQENSGPDLRAYLHKLFSGLPSPECREEQREQLRTRFWHGHFALGTKRWFQVVEQALRDHPSDLLVIDTSTSAFGIVDDNQTGEAVGVINQLRWLPAALTTLIFRHTTLHYDARDQNKVVRRTMKGAKVWKAMLDQTVFMVAEGGRPGEALRRGYKPTRLEPDKGRAYGLRGPIRLLPIQTPDGDWLQEEWVE